MAIGFLAFFSAGRVQDKINQRIIAKTLRIGFDYYFNYDSQ